MRDIDNTQDYLDVRDIIERVETLRDERETLSSDYDDAQQALIEARKAGDILLGTLEADVKAAYEALKEWDASEDGLALEALTKLLSALCGYGGDHEWEGDWYPVTLIRDSYFVEAMQELCEDIGDFPNGVPSYYVIDWEATANNLRVDYSSVEFDGVTYWYR